MPFKKDLTPLTKGGKIDKHEGKGASERPLPDRRAVPRPPANTMNDFAKAAPTITQSFASGGYVNKRGGSAILSSAGQTVDDPGGDED